MATAKSSWRTMLWATFGACLLVISISMLLVRLDLLGAAYLRLLPSLLALIAGRPYCCSLFMLGPRNGVAAGDLGGLD